ncbi:hypothetical protein [uncultured Roseibium sp.]|uniref:hypothetical protein n=1 Tax=uncultured Roseibium sp. TaxID=1936171 RepID=UPI003216A05C
MTTRTLKGFACATLMVPAFMTNAFAADAADGGYRKIRSNMDFRWTAEDHTVRVTFFTGCRSGHSGGKLSEYFSASFDKAARRIEISGSFLFKPLRKTSKIGPADCMGSRTRTLEIKNVPEGTYEVTRDGRKPRVVELVGESVEYRVRVFRNKAKSISSQLD